MKKILIVVGTSREKRKTINAATALKQKLDDSKDLSGDIFDLKENKLPFLTKRRYKDENPDPNVELFGSKVEEADCVTLVTPEYNHSIPGELKNALDHLYPEYEDTLFSYITTSAGGFGGIRCQSHLHDITLTLKADVGPNMPISNISSVFNEDGEIIEEEYEERFDNFIKQIDNQI